MLHLANSLCKSVPIIIFLAAIFYAADNLLGILLLPKILQLIQNKAAVSELLKTIVLFSTAMMFCKGVQGYLQTNTHFGRIDIRSHLVFKLGEKIMTTSYSNLDKKDFILQKNKATEVTSGNSDATEAIWTTLESLLKNCLGFTIYLFLLSFLNFKIIFLTLSTSVVSFAVTNYANNWRYNRRMEEEELINKIGYITRKTKNKEFAKDIRIFGMQNWLAEVYEKYLNLYEAFQLKGIKRYFFADIADIILTVLKNSLAYFWLITLVINTKISISQFVLYFSAIGIFTQWVTGILSEISTLHKQSLDISCYREFIEYEEPFLFEKGASVPLLNENTIELKDVSFYYANSTVPILDNLNLKLSHREKLAIVGLNGAGKTTLIKILMGLYAPTEGSVLFNGVDVQTLNRYEYYKCFSAVFQQFSILPASIAANVSQDTDTIDLKKVEHCLNLAGLLDKINSLPQGIQTLLCKDVFTEAVELSGGEIQKLLIARSIYKDTPFLILDEPTAALDPLAEQEIYEKYNALAKNKSSIFISHRLASTRFCDKIIFLQNGKIIEEGSHIDLLKLNGEYAKLFHVQSKYYKE